MVVPSADIMRYDPIDVLQVERVKRHVLRFARKIENQFPKPSPPDSIAFSSDAHNTVANSSMRYLIQQAMQGHEVPLMDVLQRTDDDQETEEDKECARDMKLPHFWDLRQAALLFIDVPMAFGSKFDVTKLFCPSCGHKSETANGGKIRQAGYAPGLFAVAEKSGRLHLIKQMRYRHYNCPTAVDAAVFENEAKRTASTSSSGTAKNSKSPAASSHFLAWDPGLVAVCYDAEVKKHYEKYLGDMHVKPLIKDIEVAVPTSGPRPDEHNTVKHRTSVQLWGQPMFHEEW